MKDLNNLIGELVEASLDEVLRGFNFQKFKHISAHDVRPRNKEEEEEFAWSKKTHPEIDYAEKYLPSISLGGSSRTVFALSGGKALKIAMNNRGLAQNKAEVDIWQKSKGSPLITRVFDFSPDYKWVVAEIVRGASLEEFANLTNIPERWAQSFMGESPEELQFQLNKLTRARELPKWLESKKEALTAIFQDKKALDFLNGLWDFVKTFNLHPGDIIPKHFGVTVDGHLRLYDYGLTKDVAKTEYGIK